MTYLSIVNKILVRLRETEVTSVAQTSYSRLIGELVNQTKREVEDAWKWIPLRTTIQAVTEVGTFRYTLTNAGNRFQFLHAFNDTSNLDLELTNARVMSGYFNGESQVSGSPIKFDFNGSTDGDPNVDVWPVPDAIENLNFDIVLPQVDLSVDTDILTVPEYPVILGAYAKAAAERGEDGGFMFAEAESNYQKALADAIAIDAHNVPSELIWGID